MPAFKLSIGLPVFNGQEFLRDSLDCILSQTFQDFELIISDNCSSDETEAICRAYAKRDRRIRFVRQKTNRGAAWNFNNVFNLASAKYFKWAAADDLMAPDFCARCVSVLDASPETVLAYAKTLIIDEYGERKRLYHDNLSLQADCRLERYKKFNELVGECNAVFGVIRSEALTRTRLIGNFISSDVCLLASLTLHGKFYKIPESLFYRRDHPAASSNNRSIERQLYFFDPRLRGKIALPRARIAIERYRAVSTSPASFIEKLNLMAFLTSNLVKSRRNYIAELRGAVRELILRLYRLGFSHTEKPRTR